MQNGTFVPYIGGGKNMKKYFLLLVISTMYVSCSTPDTSISAQIQGNSSQSVLYLNCKAVSEDEIEFEFSRPVTIRNLVFFPDIPIESIENGSTVRVKLKEGAVPGNLITADLLAEDENKNTINVLVSLRARNNRMPDILINELCTEYSNPKTEFIEFLIKSDGNLGGMRVIIHGNSNASRQTIYEFKPVEVKENDFVVLHLRTVDDNCIDEYGDNLDESGGKNATPGARDFWIPGNTKLVHKEATIIYVLDQDDKVLTALIVTNKPDPWWSKDYFADAAIFLYNQGVWLSPEGHIPRPADAANSTGTTNTRTINRDEAAENPNTAAAWYVTVTSGATPGRTNNLNRN